MRKKIKALLCLLLIVVMSFSDLAESYEAEAKVDLSDITKKAVSLLKGFDLEAYLDSLPPKNLYLSEVKKLALSKSKSYKKIKTKIKTKQAKYTDAVKRIAAKKKKLATFSWTPLLSFKFPTDPSFTEEFDFYFKPISIQAEITNLKHQLNDEIYAVYEKATNLYVEIYTLQEKINFNKKQLESTKNTLVKNEARLALGLALESDVKAIKKSITKLEKTITTNERKFTNQKEKLKKMIGIEIRSRYIFLNPYKEAVIERANLEDLTKHTLANSQAVFEAMSNTSLARFTLDEYDTLMRNRYGSKMDMVNSYVVMARNGEEVDGGELLDKFNELLKEIDKKWDGKLKILFIKIPKLWFKGPTAGSRYIEDEPYALYNAILDYQEARLAEESTRDEVATEVKDSFENLKTLETTYRDGKENLEAQKKELEQALIKNQMGLMEFSEYTDLQKEYEDAELDLAGNLDAYTQALMSFDRLTCGGITKLLTDGSFDAEDTVGGESYLVAEIVEGMSYYIKVQHESNIFELGLFVPDDYEVEVTDYELWIDNVKIVKQPVDKNIRHLGFNLDGSERVFLRFYKDEDMICDVDIDPSQYSGAIDLIEGYVVKKKEEEIIKLGEYSIKADDSTGTVSFTFTADKELSDAATFKLLNAQGVVLGDMQTDVGQPMVYLSLLQGSVGDITVAVFDAEGKQIGSGTPDPETMTVKGKKEGGDAQ